MANFELKYGTQKHTDLREALRERVEHADHAVSKKKTDYAHDEERFMAYLPERTADDLRRAKKKDGEPQYVDLEIPYSYAVLMSWHTYISSVFLSRTPVMQFMGRHGESEQQVQAVEAIMDYQTTVGGHMVPYYIWLLDAGKYGVGIIGNYWEEEITQVSSIEEEPVSYLGIPLLGKTRKVKKTKRVKGYEGNKVFNVRPQDFIFDSRVSLANFQKGEWCGRFADLGWLDIVKRAEYGQYYNMEALRAFKRKKHKRGTSGNVDRDLGTSQQELPDAITQENAELSDDARNPDFAELTELHVKLIPNDWGLGKSKYPEIWVFTLADDEVIIESQPSDALHGKFPYGVLEYEIEGYSLQKRSMLEMLNPLNDTMTWLVNAHFYNVRSVLNGQFIIDPSRLTVKDFKSEGGGRLVRLKPMAYGQDVRTMFHQISTQDVTRDHLRDASAVGDMIQRVSGVTDNIMGMVNAGGRKTATEVRSSNTFGANRLKTQAEYFSAMGFTPHAAMLLQNTQQKYDGDMKYKIAGDLMDEGAGFTQVTAEMIAGNFDFSPVDGTMPVDRFAQVQMWTNLMTQMRNMPEIGQGYDLAGIFAWVAQLGGLKNIKRFRVNVVPDGQARGIPVGGAGGASGARGAGGTPENSTGLPGAGQIQGLGPAG